MITRIFLFFFVAKCRSLARRRMKKEKPQITQITQIKKVEVKVEVEEEVPFGQINVCGTSSSLSSQLLNFLSSLFSCPFACLRGLFSW
jgi:hypothetical protein